MSLGRRLSRPRPLSGALWLVGIVTLLAPPAALAQASPGGAQRPKKRPRKPDKRVLPSFSRVYARDHAELAAQRAALQKALATETRRGRERELRVDKQVKAALARLSRLRAEVSQLETELTKQREKDTVSDSDLGLVRTALQVGAGKLRAFGVDVNAKGAQDAALLKLVDRALEVGDRFSRIHVRPGRFYGKDGRRVEGTIVWLGRVGALGLGAGETAASSGILRPAPGGGLRLHRAGVTQARALAEGRALGEVSFFLFDERDPPQTGEHEKGAMAQIDKGGPIAWIIIGLALLGALLVIERLLLLAWRHDWRRGARRGLEAQIAKGETPTIPRGSGCVGVVLRHVLACSSRERKHLEDRAAEAVLQRVPALERSFAVLTVIVAAAPLLGLLGTVTGMIATFDVITRFGTGDPKLLSGGISEALITTKWGLSVAVPLLLARSFLSRWSDRLVEEMQTQALTVINAIEDADRSASTERQPLEKQPQERQR